MRIGIDCRFWGEQGHGRYVRNLVRELAKVDHENEYVIFLRQKDYDSVNFTNPKFVKVRADIRWYTLKEQCILPWIYYKANLDLLHVPHFNIPVLYYKPLIITMHDLTVSHFPSIRSTTLPLPIWKTKRFLYHIVLWIALQRARTIITVSDFVKGEVQRHYPFTKDKIVVTHEAVEQLFINRAQQMPLNDPHINAAKLQYGIKDQYLIYIGNVHPHKNIERVIRVFCRLHEKLPNVQLVLAGKDDYFQKRLKMETGKWKLENSIVWTGFVPDDDLIALLKGAAAFVFPSLMEGFGIPPLEAMACGTPTIVSNAASLPEVCGDASAYFNPKDEDEMYARMNEVLTNADLRAQLIQKGYQQTAKYSWKTLAQQTYQTYIE